MRSNLIRYWYRSSLNLMTFLLLPFSWLFHLIVIIRRSLYKKGILKTFHFKVPVIVVGNLTVGGTGKTPFVIWLAKFLQSKGYQPGIVSRGVGGKAHHDPYLIKIESTVEEIGDEAMLITQATKCPMVICINRAKAVQHLQHISDCNIIISDDGLQHYRLGRMIEIVLVDSQRGFGNQQLLPAGPLREPLSRLKQVDFLVYHGNKINAPFNINLELSQFISLVHPKQKILLSEFPKQKIHAIAGIGHPERFFLALEQAGFEVIPHAFPDHYRFKVSDFNFNDTLPIVMTHKDAVKCLAFADQRYWYADTTLTVSSILKQQLLNVLKERTLTNDNENDFSSCTCQLDIGANSHGVSTIRDKK